MTDLSGKVALATGAGRGIGKGIALQLARCGADLVINDRPGNPDLNLTGEEIRALGRTCHAIEGDVFTRAGCERLVQSAIELTGRIDILISNPAYSRRGTFLDYSPEEFERTINGTLTSGFHISQLVARQMVSQGEGGKIVFISSVQAEMPISRCAPYGAAKAGLNAIEPGWIDTPGERISFSDETIAAEGQQLPWGRLGLPEEIGHAAAFLVSDQADYVTATVLPVDGCFRFKDCLPEKAISPVTTP